MWGGGGWVGAIGMIPDGAGATAGVDSDSSEGAGETTSTIISRSLPNENIYACLTSKNTRTMKKHSFASSENNNELTLVATTLPWNTVSLEISFNTICRRTSTPGTRRRGTIKGISRTEPQVGGVAIYWDASRFQGADNLP